MFGFRIIISVVLILLQSLVYFTFVNFLKTTKFYKPAFRWYALIPFLVFNVPFIIIALFFSRNFNPPEWFRVTGMAMFYVWQGATFLIAVWLLIGKIIKLPFKAGWYLYRKITPLPPFRKGGITLTQLSKRGNDLTPSTQLSKRGDDERLPKREEDFGVRFDRSRRKFMRTATAAFSGYAFIGATSGLIKSKSYEINYTDIKINNLPPELKGVTITLFSDIHAGQYMNEKDMLPYAEAVNELGSDIICVPGDFVNFQPEDVKGVASAFKDLKAKYGIYGSLGNHDYFQNPDYVADVLNNESPIKVLRNSHEKISINGKDIYILGAEDNSSSGTRGLGIVLDYLDKSAKDIVSSELNYINSPKILLCHKPYAFDDMAKRNVDLILSGHTHGGQLVPIRFGNLNVSFAATVSKYIEGLYTIGNVNMYVSRGIGTVALPIRINCPPEITKIRLV